MPEPLRGVRAIEASPRSPPNVIVPESGGWAPARILSSVDLPAPFSPSSAWISPGATARSTSIERLHAGEALADAGHAEQAARSSASPDRCDGSGSGADEAWPARAVRLDQARSGRRSRPTSVSPRRSALSRLSLVMTIGVSRTSGSGLVPSRRKATSASTAPRLWPPGNCSTVAVSRRRGPGPAPRAARRSR